MGIKLIVYNLFGKQKLLMAICLMAIISGVATAHQAIQKAPVKKEVKATAIAEKPKPAAAVTAGPKKQMAR